MPEAYVSPQVSKIIDEQLMAQTGLELSDLEAEDWHDWLRMSDRIQPHVHVPDDPDDFFDNTGIE